MKRLRWFLIATGGLLLVAGVALTVYRQIGRQPATEQTNDAYTQADFSMLAAKVPGLVEQVLVDDNQSVKKGQLLAKLDSRDYQTALNTARAEMAIAQATATTLNAQLGQQSSVIRQQDASLLSDEAAIAFDNANSERYQKLSQDGSGTQQEQQETATRLKQSLAVKDRDTAGSRAARQQIDVLQGQLMRARAEQQRAAVAVKQAELNLSYTEIRAPFDGVVGSRTIRVGQYINPGTTLLALVPLNEIYVVSNYREVQLEHIRDHAKVSIHVDSYPNLSFTGYVESVAPATGVSFAPVAPDNATGNFTKVVQRIPVKIRFDQQNAHLDLLRVGMSVVTTVETDSTQRVAEQKSLNGAAASQKEQM